MRKMMFIRKRLWLLVLPVLLLACESKMDEHYEIPGWLKGSAWEVLEARGNYTIFLKGIELAGFKPMVEGKSILTVMAPDDEAFGKYLKSVNRNSIENFTKEELVKLIGFHLLYYSYDKSRLVNYRPEGDDITEEQSKVNAGLYYKFRSKGQDAISFEQTEDAANPGQTKTVGVYHPERLLPVFSKCMFETKQIDPSYNYKYFYPNSEWTGPDGFNVSNASVREYEIVSDNGYVYCIDRVIEPLETIYAEMLKRKDRYSLFLEAYNQFMTNPLEKDKTLTNDYGNGQDLYQITHKNLPSIACEWTNTDFKQIADNAKNACNVFAPSNEAFTAFFNTYWKAGDYTSLNEVYKVALLYLLKEYSNSGSIVFPEEITKGKLISAIDGKPFTFDVERVGDRVMCSNGIFYGLSDMKVPAAFKSVVGSAFQKKGYSIFLFMLDNTKMIKSMSSNDSRFIVLQPSNIQMNDGGISVNPEDESKLMIVKPSGVAAMTSVEMSDYISIHVAMSEGDLFDGQTRVLKTNASYNYWYVKNNKIINSNDFNNLDGSSVFRSLSETKYNKTENWTNGKVYTYEGALLQPTPTKTLMKALSVNPETSSISYQFTQLLIKAGLISTETISFIEELKFLAFIPSNNAILTAMQNNKIPGIKSTGTVTDKEALANWLKYYFIRTDDSGLTDYPYVGSGMNLTCYSYATDAEGNYLPIEVMDNGQRIVISNQAGDQAIVVDNYDQFPLVYSDGCLHIIDGVIEYKNN